MLTCESSTKLQFFESNSQRRIIILLWLLACESSTKLQFFESNSQHSRPYAKWIQSCESSTKLQFFESNSQPDLSSYIGAVPVNHLLSYNFLKAIHNGMNDWDKGLGPVNHLLSYNFLKAIHNDGTGLQSF